MQKQHLKSPRRSEDLKVNERIENAKKDAHDASPSVSQVKNELSQGISISKQARKHCDRSSVHKEADEPQHFARHDILISLNSGDDGNDNGELLRDGRQQRGSKQLEDQENATPPSNGLESPGKVSQSQTQNLSYRTHHAAKSPNTKSVNLRSYRSQNSELSEFYDQYSKNSNQDGRQRLQSSMNRRKRLKRSSRNRESKQTPQDKL